MLPLGSLLFLFGASVLMSLCAWLSAVECAVAAIVLWVEDPITVLNIMGFVSLRWLFPLISFLQMVLRVDKVLELCCIEFL